MTQNPVMTSSFASKIEKLANFVIFRVISIITLRQMYLEMLSTIYLINVDLGAQRAPPVDALRPPAAQHKQAKPLVYIKSDIPTSNVFRYVDQSGPWVSDSVGHGSRPLDSLTHENMT